MAIGNKGNNSNNNTKQYIQEHYSIYNMSNVNSPLDPSKLSYGFWAGKLKISISPLKKTNDNSIAFDYENNISVYVTHTKAYILSTMIKEWIKDKSYAFNVSIDTGSNGMVTLSDGVEYGLTIPCVVLKNVDENGETKSSFVYTIKDNYHYGIKNYNDKTKDYERVYFDDLEIMQLIQVLDSYVESATGAQAAFIAEELKYDFSRLNTKSNLICEKLGIQSKDDKGNYSKKPSSSFFSKSTDNNSVPVKNSSINDLDDGLE